MSRQREEVKAKIREANKVLRQLRNDGYGELSIIRLAQKSQLKLTKTGSKVGEFVIGKTAEKDLAKLDKLLDTFLNSNWVTEEGRAKIREKTVATMSDNPLNAITEQQADTAIDIFSSDVASMLRDKYMLPSDVVITAVREIGDALEVEKMLHDMDEDFTREESLSREDMLQYVIDWIEEHENDI